MRDDDAARWLRAKQLLLDALDLPVDQRSGWLEAQCGDDTTLLSEVVQLLTAHQATDSLLDSPAAAPAMPIVELAGRSFGPYKVLRALGQGGMGSVWLAERSDGAYDAHVAIKIVRRGMETAALIERFHRERQILARLQHPNIARLIDGGVSDDGLPYLVMEFVDGQLLADYVRDHRLDQRARLMLFRTICDAVTHAHVQLIVHRDLKPANVLVTHQGQPKLLDFGIAKLIDETQPQATATLILTPEYSSPEQWRGGAVSTATDVYMLGVLLFELLTGERPWPSGPRDLDALPPRPSSRTRTAVDADLDEIVSKAMRPEPALRYASVERLDDDVRRHLAGLPVSARGESWRYRASKFLRRHRMAAVAAVLLVISLIAGIASTLRQSQLAARNAAEARGLANTLLFDVHDAISSLPGAIKARQLLVQRALGYLDGLASQAQSDDTIARELIAGYRKMGKLQGDLAGANVGDANAAMLSIRKARSMAEALAERTGCSDDQLLLAKTRHELAEQLYWRSDYPPAEAEARAALEMFQSALPNRPVDQQLRIDLARCQNTLGDILYWQDHLDDALVEYQASLTLMQTLLPASPDEPKLRTGVARCSINVGETLSWLDRQSEAEPHYLAAIAIDEQIILASPENPVLAAYFAGSCLKYAGFLSSNNRTADALEYSRKALAVCERSAKADPADSNAQRSWASALSTVGENEYPLAQFDQARAHFERALAIHRRLAAADPGRPDHLRNVALMLGRLADLERAQHREPEALPRLREAIAIHDRFLQNNEEDSSARRDRVAVAMQLIFTSAALGDQQEACDWARRSVQDWKVLEAGGQLRPYDKPTMATALHALSQCAGSASR